MPWLVFYPLLHWLWGGGGVGPSRRRRRHSVQDNSVEHGKTQHPRMNSLTNTHAMSRPVSTDERQAIRDLRQCGWTLQRIGHLLGRAPSLVLYHADPDARERQHASVAAYKRRQRRGQGQASA